MVIVAAIGKTKIGDITLNVKQKALKNSHNTHTTQKSTTSTQVLLVVTFGCAVIGVVLIPFTGGASAAYYF